MIVVDASLMTAWLLNEPSLPAAFDIDGILGDRPIVVPGHWPIEISNALRTNLKAGKLGPAHFHVIVDKLDQLEIRPESAIALDDVIGLAQFAVAHDLTAYDAAYVQLAFERGFVLATLDKAMRNAALRLGVRVVPE